MISKELIKEILTEQYDKINAKEFVFNYESQCLK
jgi:hypothetical protein